MSDIVVYRNGEIELNVSVENESISLLHLSRDEADISLIQIQCIII